MGNMFRGRVSIKGNVVDKRKKNLERYLTFINN